CLPLNPLVTKPLNARLIDRGLIGGAHPARRAGFARHPSASGNRSPLPDNARPALAEADRRKAVTPAMSPEDDLVAVCEKGAGLAGVQRGRALAGIAQLA